MNGDYAEIKAELELTKKELQSRLNARAIVEASSELWMNNDANEKEAFIVNRIKEDLHDVERALAKMKAGVYGICEETGQEIPLKKLKILPSARSIHDFSFSELLERSAPPRYDNPQKATVENIIYINNLLRQQ